MSKIWGAVHEDLNFQNVKISFNELRGAKENLIQKKPDKVFVIGHFAADNFLISRRFKTLEELQLFVIENFPKQTEQNAVPCFVNFSFKGLLKEQEKKETYSSENEPPATDQKQQQFKEADEIKTSSSVVNYNPLRNFGRWLQKK